MVKYTEADDYTHALMMKKRRNKTRTDIIEMRKLICTEAVPAPSCISAHLCFVLTASQYRITVIRLNALSHTEAVNRNTNEGSMHHCSVNYSKGVSDFLSSFFNKFNRQNQRNFDRFLFSCGF